MWKGWVLSGVVFATGLSCGPDVGSGDGSAEGSGADTGGSTATGSASDVLTSTTAPSTTGNSTGATAAVTTVDTTTSTETSSSDDNTATSLGTSTGTGTDDGGCPRQMLDVAAEDEVCGDGRVTGAEECEDGNAESFDGCSAVCRIEHPIVKVRAGPRSTCALAQNGVLKCWGHDWYGLGYGDIEGRGDEPDEMGSHLPAIDLGAEVTDISTVGVTRCALTVDNEIRCWGFGDTGGLGYPFEGSAGDEPGEMGCALENVNVGEAVAGISAADSCAILASGGVKCWGSNYAGQLGLGDSEDRGDEPAEMGESLPTIPLGAEIVALHRLSRTCAVDVQGRLKCWGSNDNCLLGRPDGSENVGDEPGEMEALDWMNLGSAFGVADFSMLDENACAVFEDGSLKCWGFNDHGFLYETPNYIVYGCGANQMGDNLPAMELGPDQAAVQVSVAHQYGCLLLDDGAVKCWGNPGDGRLGNGTEDFVYFGMTLADIPAIDLGGESATQMSVGLAHACALLESGYVKCWGRNERGQLGYGDTENRGDEPGEMGTNLPYVELF